MEVTSLPGGLALALACFGFSYALGHFLAGRLSRRALASCVAGSLGSGLLVIYLREMPLAEGAASYAIIAGLSAGLGWLEARWTGR